MKKLKKNQVGVFILEKGKIRLNYIKLSELIDNQDILWIIHPKVMSMQETSESSMPLILLEPEGSKKIYHFKSCKIKSIHIVFYDFVKKQISTQYQIENPFLEEIKLERFDCY